MKNKSFIILEIIPTASNPEKGSIIQLSALKIKDLKLLDRFDYRLNDEALPIPEMKSWIDYDKDAFIYVDSDKSIINNFKEWSKNYTIIVIDNIYTPLYLKELDNRIEFIYDYLDLEYSNDLIEIIMHKYHLEPSNYIVDLLYEALIYHYQ